MPTRSSSDAKVAWRSAGCPLPDVEPRARQPVDVVRQADDEQKEDEQEPDGACPLHDAERDPASAHLLDQAPEDMPPVQGEEREEVDDCKGEADDREKQQRVAGAVLDRLMRDVADPDHP